MLSTAAAPQAPHRTSLSTWSSSGAFSARPCTNACLPALKLAVIHTAKLMTHNSALYRQTLAQVPQSRLLHRLLGATELFGLASWERWRAPLCADGAVQKAPSLFAAERKALRARASQRRAAKGAAGRRRGRGSRKRTVFSFQERPAADL